MRERVYILNFVFTIYNIHNLNSTNFLSCCVISFQAPCRNGKVRALGMYMFFFFYIIFNLDLIFYINQ